MYVFSLFTGFYLYFYKELCTLRLRYPAHQSPREKQASSLRFQRAKESKYEQGIRKKGAVSIVPFHFISVDKTASPLFHFQRKWVETNTERKVANQRKRKKKYKEPDRTRVGFTTIESTKGLV